MGGGSGADVASLLGRVTQSTTTHAHSSQQDPNQQSSVLDVWSHSYDGMSDRLGEVASDPTTLVTNRIDLARAVGTGLVSGGAGTTHSQAVDSMAAQMEGLGDGVSAISRADGALATIGATFAFLTSIEQMLSTAFSIIPFPAFPALRILDFDVGLPHAHNHPPNLTPPNPVPVPLPSTGPVIPIPIFSGASKTLINGMPAARCGDMGLGIWCGGYFPMYEVFLGSSSVWIEGARASRLAMDITKHCIFTSPKPSDPPIGPMVGFTVMASTNVLIGGVPMPSLLSLGIGAAMKGLFAGIGRLVRALRSARAASRAGREVISSEAETAARAARPPRPSPRDYWDRLLRNANGNTLLAMERRIAARRYVDNLLRDGNLMIGGDRRFQRLVDDDLMMIASSRTGRESLERIRNSPNRVYVEPLPPGNRMGNNCAAHSDDALFNESAGRAGRGSDSTVQYDPDRMSSGGTPPDASLNHELGHGANNATGTNRANSSPEPDNRGRYPDMEEENVIDGVDNPYRHEQGLNPRYSHSHLPAS